MTPEPIPHPAEGAATTKEAAAIIAIAQKMAARIGLEFEVDSARLAAFEAAGGRTPLTPDPAKAGQADEVARLRVEVDKLRGALIATCNNIGAYADTRVSSDFLMHIPEEARLVLMKANERATAAEARNKVLEEAVRPFAEAADAFYPDDADTMRPATVQALHFRRARSALSQAREGGEHGE